MEEKTIFIKNEANRLTIEGEYMTGQDLVHLLNENNFKTSYGTLYSGGRGVYRLLDAVYIRLKAESGEGKGTDAHNVATRFTDKTGGYAWRFKPENQ